MTALYDTERLRKYVESSSSSPSPDSPRHIHGKEGQEANATLTILKSIGMMGKRSSLNTVTQITGTTEYFDEIQNNRNSVKSKHIEIIISTFRLNYSHHQEMSDDDITLCTSAVYTVVTRYG